LVRPAIISYLAKNETQDKSHVYCLAKRRRRRNLIFFFFGQKRKKKKRIGVNGVISCETDEDLKLENEKNKKK
jgi:hypothetical protein